MMRIAIAVLLCAGAGMAAEPVWFWDMETENATIYAPGSDSTPFYYANVFRSDSQAYEGSWSLRTEGVWAAATFDNKTDEHVWATPGEGTVVFYWQYHAPWGDQMLFQLTGKCQGCQPGMDTNDGVGIRTRGDSPGVFAGGGRNDWWPVTMEEGRWYRFILRYASDRGVAFQIDDSRLYFSGDSSYSYVPSYGVVAWHQILIGNDRNSSTVKQNIDNFAIYDHWLDEAPASFVPGAYLRQNNELFTVAAGPNPMHDVIRFDAGTALTKSITVFNGTGTAVWNSGASSLPAMQWNGDGAAAGTYFYRVETADGVRTGSFMKISE